MGGGMRRESGIGSRETGDGIRHPAPMMIEGRDYEFHAPLTRREALRRTLADLRAMAGDIWRYYRGRRPLLCMQTEDKQA